MEKRKTKTEERIQQRMLKIAEFASKNDDEKVTDLINCMKSIAYSNPENE